MVKVNVESQQLTKKIKKVRKSLIFQLAFKKSSYKYFRKAYEKIKKFKINLNIYYKNEIIILIKVKFIFKRRNCIIKKIYLKEQLKELKEYPI